MKKICIVLCGGLFSFVTYGQNVKSIAVVATSSDIDKTELHLIEDDFQRELLNASDNLYDIRIGKSDEFFAERNAEMNFQHSGAVDEEQVKEYGKLMGVEQLCVIVVEKRKANDYYLRAKIYDVETGRLRKTASYPDSFERDLPIQTITDYYALQRANRYLISRIGILDRSRQAKWDEKLKAYDDEKGRADAEAAAAAAAAAAARKRAVDSKALVASLVPGLGLMQKGHKSEGTAYLIGDIMLVGGGVGMLAYANYLNGIINDRTSDYDAYNRAVSSYNTVKTTGIVSLSCAGALYILNLVRAYIAEPRYGAKLQYTFAPIYPINSGSGIEPGLGFSIAYNF